MPVRALLATALASAVGIGPLAPAAGAQTGARLYVADQGAAKVSVVDVDRHELVATIDLVELGFSENAKPHHAVVEPDGSHWYVSLIGENRVLKFDRDNRLVAQAELEVPGLMAIDPVRDRLYVGRSMTAVNPPPSVTIVRRSDMAVEDVIDVLFPRPHALAVTADGAWVYTASLAENRFAVIDAETGDVELVDVPADAEMPHPHTLVQFAISPDGRRLVAGGEMSGDFLVWDLADPAAPELVEALELGGAPWHPSFTPDGRLVFVGNLLADRITVLDAETWEVVETIEGEGIVQPHGSAVSPDGSKVFVSNRNTSGEYHAAGTASGSPPPGTLVVLDAATREVLAVLDLPPHAAGIGTMPPAGADRAPAD